MIGSEQHEVAPFPPFAAPAICLAPATADEDNTIYTALKRRKKMSVRDLRTAALSRFVGQDQSIKKKKKLGW